MAGPQLDLPPESCHPLGGGDCVLGDGLALGRRFADPAGLHVENQSTAADLARIYQKLDELEPVESDQEAVRPVDELFYWPLAGALLVTLAALAYVVRPGLRRSVAPA